MSATLSTNTATKTSTVVDNDVVVVDSDSPSTLEERIVFILTVFPRLTPSMLQVGLGPHTPPRLWRPVVEDLIQKKVVKRDERGVTTPIGQYRTYTFLTLTKPEPLESMMARYRSIAQ